MAIQTENIIINDKEYTRTYSDLDMMIERDGVPYSEAVDLVDSGREYTETDIPIEADEEATIEDYQSALSEMGVKFND